MADVDISTTQAVSVLESAGFFRDEATTRVPSVVDAISAADVVSTAPVMALKLYRGTNAVTVTLITGDWALVETYRQFKNSGVALKGIILRGGSGGSDVFVIKDGDENGAYLYSATVGATTTVVVYPGSYCRPFIDFSECTLTAGHKVTFVW